MEKKNIAIIVLAVALVVSGIGNILLVLNFPPVDTTTYSTFRVGAFKGPYVIDPIDSWDSASNDVIAQVTETLFWYDLTDPDLPLEPLLAESYVWTTNKTIEITVRSPAHGYIYFHDGSRLTAEVVKWNLDRINYFINATGTLAPPTFPAFPAPIYFLPDGKPIINKTEVLSEMVVEVTLNGGFGSFVPLMTYTGSSMVSMQSHSNTTYIDLATEKLIGTGPYMYDYYKSDIEVRFHRFNRYWRTNPYFEILILEILSGSESRCQAMLGHSVDMIFGCESSSCCDLRNDPLTTIVETGPDLIYWYLAFNCYRVNVTWREAISKAINYTYITEEICCGNAVRGPPCVPSGMPGHDPTVVVAQYDIPEARTVIQSMGLGYTDGTPWDVGTQVGDTFIPGAHESLWLDATFFTDAFGYEIILNYYIGNSFGRDLDDLLSYDLDKIGLSIITLSESVFLDPPWGMAPITQEEPYSNCDMWYVGWGPDYLDAFTMLDPLFNQDSSHNFLQLNDSIVQGWLEAAAVETNITKRYELFGMLQHRLFEVLYVHIPLFASLGRVVHGVNIKGYPYNPLNSFLAWPIYRESL